MRILPLLAALVCTAACSTSSSLDDGDGDGFTLGDGDCDDTNADVNPDATEICDGLDNDCDGTIDGPDAEGARAFHADDDGDGFGDPDRSQMACEAPEGFVDDANDCDDSTAERAPGLDEICDGLDNDCDGEADNDPVDGGVWFRDTDEDGFGDIDDPVRACTQPAGTTLEDAATDCEPDVRSAYPGSTEEEIPGDGIDTDCDGLDVCVDWTCDGLPDLVLGTDSGVEIYASRVDDTLPDTPSRSLAASDVIDLGWGDVNDDGHWDLVWLEAPAGSDNELVLALGGTQADGVTRETFAVGDPSDLVVADFDGDGIDDVAVSSDAGDTLIGNTTVLYGGEDPLDRTETVQTYGAVSIEAADLDDDRAVDLVICNERGTNPLDPYDGFVQIFWGDTDEGFDTLRQSQLDVVGCRDVGVGDFDGDDQLDVVAAQYIDLVGSGDVPTDTSRVWYNDGARFDGVGYSNLSTDGAWSVAVGDYDQDGTDDVVFGFNASLTGDYDSGVWLYLGGSGGLDEEDVLYGLGVRYPGFAQVADTGPLALLFPQLGRGGGANQPNNAGWWYDDGAGFSYTEAVVPASRITPLDVDQDGRDDLVLTNEGRGSREVVVYLNGGGSFGTPAFRTDTDPVHAAPLVLGRIQTVGE